MDSGSANGITSKRNRNVIPDIKSDIPAENNPILKIGTAGWQF